MWSDIFISDFNKTIGILPRIISSKRPASDAVKNKKHKDTYLIKDLSSHYHHYHHYH